MKDPNTNFKAITKARLLEILKDLPDDTMLSPTNGHCNIGVYRGVWTDEKYYGFIDLADDTLKVMARGP